MILVCNWFISAFVLPSFATLAVSPAVCFKFLNDGISLCGISIHRLGATYDNEVKRAAMFLAIRACMFLLRLVSFQPACLIGTPKAALTQSLCHLRHCGCLLLQLGIKHWHLHWLYCAVVVILVKMPPGVLSSMPICSLL